MEDRYLRRILIHDNALLLYRYNDKDKDKVDISIRYVEGNKIHDQYLTTLPKDKLYVGLLEISHDGKSVATYKEVGEDYVLDRLYDIEDHSFGIPEFLDLEYKKAFPNNELSPQFVKKRGTKDGKH